MLKGQFNPSARIVQGFPGLGKSGARILVNELQHGSAAARRKSADALGVLGKGAAEAVPALQEALNGKDPILRIKAGNALERIQNPEETGEDEEDGK